MTVANTKISTGFTIVELLIVIVVIGILAAITIVAYNGIQSRALNGKTESAVAWYKKTLIAYATEKGKYPANNATACLGNVADYAAGVCYPGAVNTTFIDDLKSYVGSSTLPSPNTECLYMYSACRRSATFFNNPWPLDGGSNHSYWLVYMLKDGAKCTVSGLSGGTWLNPTSTPNPNGYTELNSGTSLCRVIMPDPTTL